MPGLESRRIHRWDESARKIKSDNIDTSGGIFTVAFGRQGDQWPWTAEVKTSDGATVQGEGVNALTADGQYLVQGELTINGVKVSALRNVYQKVKNEPFR